MFVLFCQTLDNMTFRADDNAVPDSVLEFGQMSLSCERFQFREEIVSLYAYFYVLLMHVPYMLKVKNKTYALRNLFIEFLSKRCQCLSFSLEMPGKSFFLQKVSFHLRAFKEKLLKNFTEGEKVLEVTLEEILAEFVRFVEVEDNPLYELLLKDRPILDVMKKLPDIGTYFNPYVFQKHLIKAIRIIESDESFPHEKRTTFWQKVHKLFSFIYSFF